MSHIVSEVPLKSPSPGVHRLLKVHRFGEPGSGPKVYMQAALHADEWPGLLALQHLIAELMEVDRRGDITGEIVIVPFANPIGMDQKLNGVVLGRHSFSAEGNYNRNWPDLSQVALDAFSGATTDPISDVRKALKAAAADLPTATPLDELKAVLLRESIDADVVLDIHCDSDALMHIYCNHRHHEESYQLAEDMGCPVLLLEDEPDGSPFDAAQVKPWLALEEQGVPLACHSVTLELRGSCYVHDDYASEDARGILRFLNRRGVIRTEVASAPEVEICCADLEALDSVRSPAAGIVAWKTELGDQVKEGQLIAEIVDLEADDPSIGRTPVYARTDGLMFTKHLAALVSPGERIAKIAGQKRLENIFGGGLLSL